MLTTQNMFELLSIPAIVLAVEAFKRALVPRRYCALLAIAIGLLIGYLSQDMMTGALLGLAASGLYSGAKSMLSIARTSQQEESWRDPV